MVSLDCYFGIFTGAELVGFTSRVSLIFDLDCYWYLVVILVSLLSVKVSVLG